MFDRRIVAFDIETIPDPDLGRRLLRLTGGDEDIVHELVRRRLAETEGGTEYPKHPWHRVVSVCATTLDPERGTVDIQALGGDALDECSHVEGFFRHVDGGRRAPRIVSWNGSGFDLPVLRYRAMMLGIAAPDFYRDADDRRWNNYQNRYHDLHVDLMDVLSGYGASTRVALGTLGQVLGLTGKAFLSRPIYEHVLAGEGALVTEYCKLDTVETLLVFLVWAHHTGRVSLDSFRRYVAATRAAVSRLPYAGWRAVEAELEGWPAWAERPAEHPDASDQRDSA